MRSYIHCAIIWDNNKNVLDFNSCCFDISTNFYNLVLILGTVAYFIAQRIIMVFYQLVRFINVIQ